MKKLKIFAVISVIAIMLTVSVSPVFAVDISGTLGSIFGDEALSDAVAGIGNLFGGAAGNESVELSDLLDGSGLDTIRGLLGGAANGVSDSALSGIVSSLFGGGGGGDLGSLADGSLLDNISKYLAGENVTTTEPPTTEEPTTEAPTTEAPVTEEPTTEEPATAAPATEAPASQYVPHTVYSGAENYTAVPVTEAPLTYEYIPPEIITAPQLTTENFTPVIYENDDGVQDEPISAKMIVGIAILVVSLVAVVAVGFVLKKSNI